MSRSQLEKITASLAVTFLAIVTLGTIILLADQLFSWDIFTNKVETALGFILLSLVMVIASSVVVNIMLNIASLATSVKNIHELLSHQDARKR